MHAQSSGQPVTAQRWSIPHSEYTTLQELVAAGGQASITLESSQGGDRRAIQATCHVTTTRQHDLPDSPRALRADLLIPGQPLHQAECRAWLEELVNAIQLYANTPEPTPPATPVALPCPVCGSPAITDKLTIDGSRWVTHCSRTHRLAGQPHPECQGTTAANAIAGWNLLATSGKYSPLPQLEDIATGWEQLGIPQQPAAQAHQHGCCGQCQHDHQPLLIGIAGKARAGKSTAAHWLQQHGFDPLAFADPIKHMLRMLGLTDDDLDGDRKETIIPALGKSPRHLMQTLGTEWGRQLIHPDIWVMAAEAMLDGHDTVFTDVRFENEAAMIRQRGGTILHIIREHPGIGSEHASESGIAIHDDDLVLHNNCELTGIGGLHAQLDAAVDLIRQRAHHCARQHPDSEAA